MHRLTASIALLAYLLGGWLLPMTHQHGATCDHASHGPTDHMHAGCGHVGHEHVGHEHADRAEPSEGRHGCSHDHSHDDAASGPLMVAGDDGSLRAGTSQTSCSGLCALCVARTLSSSDPASIHLATSSDKIAFLAIPLSGVSPLSVLLGGNGPRGPPAIG